MTCRSPLQPSSVNNGDMPLNVEDYPVRTKDPASKEDFAFNWENYLQPRGDGIASASISFYASDGETPSTDLTLTDTDISGYNVVAWISGGRKGRTYVVTCSINTNDGRTGMQHSFRLVVADK